MRYVFALTVSLLLSHSLKAQFPTYNRADDYNGRQTRRSDVRNLTVSKTLTFNGDMATTGQSIGSLQKPSGGRAWRIKAISVTSSVLAKVRILGGSYSFGSDPISNIDFWVGPTSPLNIPIDQTYRNQQTMPQLYVRSVYEASPWKFAAQVAPVALVANKSTTTTTLNNASNSYTYTLSVTNNTGSTTSGNIVLTDSLPDGVKITAASGTGWAVTIGARGRSLSATSSTAVGNGANSSVVTVTLTPQIMGDYTLSVLGDWVPNDRPRPKDVVWIGNSIDNGSGATNYETMYSQLVMDWLRDTKGIDAEMLNYSIPGVTSTQHEELRQKEQRYNFEREPYAIFYQINVNDVLSGLSNATSIANLKAIINHKKKFYPNAYLFIVAATPNGVTATENGLATLRTQAQTATNDNRDVKTYYLPSPGSAWTSTNNAANLAADLIHPNDTGHAAVATSTINDLSGILP